MPMTSRRAASAARGTTTVTPIDGDSYTISIPVTSDRTVTATIPADSAFDGADTSNTLSTGDNSVTVDLDLEDPTVTVDKARARPPATTSPVVFDVEFSENVTDFDADDVTEGGSAARGTTTVTPIDGDSYTISIPVTATAR